MLINQIIGNKIGILVLLIFIFFINSASAQKEFRISNYRKIYVNDETSKTEASVNTKKKPKAKTSKDYYWFDNYVIHKTKGGFGGYVLDGKYTEYFFPSNNLHEKGQFIKGVKNGEWMDWYPNGNMAERTRWKKGSLHGTKYSYNPNGQLEQKANWRKGGLNGKKYNYAIDGSLSTMERYRHGVLNGTKVTYKADTVYKSQYFSMGKEGEKPTLLQRIGIGRKHKQSTNVISTEPKAKIVEPSHPKSEKTDTKAKKNAATKKHSAANSVVVKKTVDKKLSKDKANKNKPVIKKKKKKIWPIFSKTD